MQEFMYDINSALIAAALLVSMVIAIEIGYRCGFAGKSSADDASRSHINNIQSSIIGILALLLAFTFSLALQRFDSRSEAVVDEANAIGTTYLRALLLPAELRDNARRLLRDYAGLRVEAGTKTLVQREEQAALMAKAAQVQNALWDSARQAAAMDPNPVSTGLFIQSLNDMIDSFGRRDAALSRHVPEVVLLLLYATFLMVGGIVGYASGVSAHRPSMVSYLMVALIVVLVFIIIDLDRPRRGLIEVDQKSMRDLQAGMKIDAGGGEPLSFPAKALKPAAGGKR